MDLGERSTIEASDQAMLDTPLENPKVRLEVSDDHMANFFDAVRSRKDPVSPVEAGHQSAVVGHLIVIALERGARADLGSVGGNIRWGRCRGGELAHGARDAKAVRLQPSWLTKGGGVTYLVPCFRDTTNTINSLTTGSRPGLQHRNAVHPRGVRCRGRGGPQLTRGLSPRRPPPYASGSASERPELMRISYDF